MSSKLKKMGKKRSASSSRGAVIDVKGERQFERDVIDADIPVLVDFWAPWCQPCKMQGPVFAAAAEQWKGRVRFAKINTEASPALAQMFRISSIPSLLVFDRGEVIDARIGLTPAAQLDSLAQRALDKHDGVTITDRVKRFFGKGTSEESAAVS